MASTAMPAGTSDGHEELLVPNLQAIRPNTLRGFLSITIQSGPVIHTCWLHETKYVAQIGPATRQDSRDSGSSDSSALTRNDPLCCAQHNGSYVEFRIMVSSSGEAAQIGRFVVRCST